MMMSRHEWATLIQSRSTNERVDALITAVNEAAIGQVSNCDIIMACVQILRQTIAAADDIAGDIRQGIIVMIEECP